MNAFLFSKCIYFYIAPTLLKADIFFAGLPITEEQLREVAEQSGVLNVPDDFLQPDFRAECQCLIPDVSEVEHKNIQDAYIFLKENFNLSSINI